MDSHPISFHPDLRRAIHDLGFTKLTEIQRRTIPLIQQGKDVIGQAFTGSGKTLAFGVPGIERILPGQGVQMLVLVPTRELCNQVAKEMRKFAKYKPLKVVEVYGGVAIEPQMAQLKTADVVIATPGRMLDHLGRGTINLSKVMVLVLDEADRMFDMGFVDDVKRIIGQTPKNRQTLLFSATMSADVQNIGQFQMRDPVKVTVQTYVDKSMLTQVYYDLEQRDKFSLLVHILKHEHAGLVLIFCSTRIMVDILQRNLERQGIKALGLHGGHAQEKRSKVMQAFKNKELDVLIASDVAARGLDIQDIGSVINYDLPKTSIEYVHRIGRTARAGAKGKVVSLLTSRDHDNFRRILDDRSLDVKKAEKPHFARVPFSMGESYEKDRGGYGRRPMGHGRPMRSSEPQRYPRPRRPMR
ncbi:MAG: DEAD/DEAH box helicase [Nanoarchaeota archaeon]